MYYNFFTVVFKDDDYLKLAFAHDFRHSYAFNLITKEINFIIMLKRICYNDTPTIIKIIFKNNNKL